MERLTRRLSDGTAYTGAVIDAGIVGANYPIYIGKAVDKLAAYEDAETKLKEMVGEKRCIVMEDVSI